MNNNINMEELMKMLSSMDKNELDKTLSQASQVLNSPKANEIINTIRKNQFNK